MKELAALLLVMLCAGGSGERPAVARASGTEQSACYAGRTAAEWRKLLSADAQVVRLTAVKALGELGQVDDLLGLLRDTDPAVRHWAAFYLRSCGTGNQGAAGSLKGLLDDPDPVVRVTAAASLAHLGDKGGIHKIIEALSNPQMGVVIWALTELRDLGQDAAPAASAVRGMLRSQVSYYRRLAQQILRNVGEAIQLRP